MCVCVCTCRDRLGIYRPTEKLDIDLPYVVKPCGGDLCTVCAGLHFLGRKEGGGVEKISPGFHSKCSTVIYVTNVTLFVFI